MADSSAIVLPPFDSPSPHVYAQAIGSAAVTSTLATVAVGARLYTKFFITKAPGWDDYFSVIALVFALARGFIQCFVASVYDSYTQVSSKVVPTTVHITSDAVAIAVLYLWAIMFAKLSILTLYITVFGQSNRTFRWTCNVVGAIVVAYCIACTPLYVFRCVSSEAQVPKQSAADLCVAVVPLNLAIGAHNIATNTALIVLPIPPLLKLQMNWKRKLALLGVFGTGAIAWAASIGREVHFVNSLGQKDTANTQMYKILWL